MASYVKRAIVDTEDMFWKIQYFLRSSLLSSWAYVDGRYNSVDGVAESTFGGETAGGSLADGDYVVLHIPATTDSDRGVVQVKFNTTGSRRVELYAHPGGWDAGTHTPKEPAQVLGDSTTIACGDDDIDELHLIVDSTRAIIWGRVTGGVTPYYFGYLGFIQSHYSDIDSSPDPNPLLVTGGRNIPGEPGSAAPMYMLTNEPLSVVTYKVLRSTGLLDTDGADMLDTMQYNYREDPPVASRTLIACLIGTATVLQKEIRGELTGVFFYGPHGSLSDETPIERSDG
jgi:hypothetical protein